MIAKEKVIWIVICGVVLIVVGYVSLHKTIYFHIWKSAYYSAGINDARKADALQHLVYSDTEKAISIFANAIRTGSPVIRKEADDGLVLLLCRLYGNCSNKEFDTNNDGKIDLIVISLSVDELGRPSGVSIKIDTNFNGVFTDPSDHVIDFCRLY